MSETQKNMSIRLAVVDGKVVEDSFQRIGNKGSEALNKIAHATAPANAGLKTIDASARALNSLFRQAAGMLAAYTGISSLINSIRSINQTGMEFQGVATALQAISGSSAGAADEMGFLSKESERLGLNLLETAKSYMQIAAASKGTNMAGRTTREIFTAVAEASTVLQLSVDQTNGALRAIGQIMSKGKVQTEELRGQLGERLYGAFQLAARGMGITTAQLDKMLQQGKVAADEFLPRFAAEIRKTFSEGVPQASQTARAELNRFNNSILEIERTIAASGFLDGLTQGYKTLSTTLSDPEVIEAAKAIGETLGNAISGAATALAYTAKYADEAALAIGSLIVARTVAGAVSMLNMAILGNAGMVVGLRMAASISTLFAAKIIAVSTAARIASISMTGLKAALAFLGGPVGLAVLGGTALAALAYNHHKAADGAKEQSEELDKLNQEMNKNLGAVETPVSPVFNPETSSLYQEVLKQARDDDLKNAKDWESGIKRGFKSVIDEASNMAKTSEQLVTNAFKSMEDSLVSFVTKGKFDFRSLADSIISDVLRMQIQKSITAPLSAALGSIFGAAHTGGVIGKDSLGTRKVNPLVFANAPKFHSGGLVGNEVPIIAKKGETVFTPGQMQALGGALNSKPNVNISVNIENNASGVGAKTAISQDQNGGINLKVFIDEVETTIARNIGRGEGLSTTLERRYGLNPAVGSYR